MTSMRIIEIIETSPLAAGGSTRGMEVTRKRLRTRLPPPSRRRGKMQVIPWTKIRRKGSILERKATTSHWQISSLRKGRTVAVVTRQPLRLESLMVRTQKQLWWLLHRPSETCRRARKYLLTTSIFIFRQSSLPTSNTHPFSMILFIRLDVFENLWHSFQNHAFVMV